MIRRTSLAAAVKAAAITAALALTASVVVAVPAAAAPTTVSAVDFEDGTFSPWVASGGGADTLSVIDLDGGKVLQVAGRNADYVGIQSPAGTFEAGKTYALSMRVKLAAGTAGSAGVRLVMKPAYNWIGNTTMTADAWTTVEGSFTAPANADPATLQAYIGTGDLPSAAPYTYLVDDILVTTEAVAPDAGPDPNVVPGGAVNPTVAPVAAAQGTGNVAALTFDDGPNPGTTPALLDYLAENDLTAVFCVIGQNITAPGGADILRRIVAEGHVLCNHSTGYADMGGLTAAQARADLTENLEIIRDAAGDPNLQVPFWRAPNGSWGATREVAVSLGMQPLAVTNTINDWATQDVPTLTANLRTAMKPGEIVLAHDGGGDRTGTLAAVRTVVDERLAAGWTFSLPVGTPAPAVEPSALSTDFEDGLDGWAPRADGTGTPTVTLTTTSAHGGAQAALVSDRTSQGSGILHDATGVLVPGQTYELSAWVRFAAGQPTDAVWLSMARTVDGATSYGTIAQFSGISNSAWTEVRTTFQMGPADSAQLYFETNYNGTNTSDFLIDDITVTVPEPAVVQDLEPIKDTTSFPVGVAIDSRETTGTASELLIRHFNQVTPENFMKPEAWYDATGQFRPNPEAIALMDYARDNDLRVYGHVLVWHSQTPAWFFQDAAGQPLTTSDADKQILRDRMRTHIFNIAQWLSANYGEFGAGNPVTAFDVVNEVVSDSGEFADGLRRSEWYRILGEEFIDLAFEYADASFNGEYAAAGTGRPVTLFINDYNTEQGGKQDRYAALVDRLLARDVPIDGVGHQFHVSLAMPVSALAGALERFADLPLVQVVTELDVTTGTPVTDAKLIDQGYYYRDAFRVFREYADQLYSVTVWGLTDGRSWRVDNGDPLVFDDGYQAKPAYYGIVDSGDLPAPLRTAGVFQGDVALDAAATGSLEWQKLPLLPIEQVAGFQLRWTSDHLTAYVSVDDADPQASDAVTFRVGGETFTVGRDGEGDADAVVTEREGGYDLVVHLPLSAATSGSTVEFDVSVSDGGEVAGWNAAGVLGTLTLLESLSYTDVVETSAAPEIDGDVDAGWMDAEVVTTDKQIQGTGGATATVRTLWKDNMLYVLAEVADPVVDVSGSDPWVQDSVEIFVDAGNYKNGSYRYDDTQIRISATNVVSFGTGDEAFQQNRLTSATATTDGGYIVEAAISLLEEGGLGTFHGLDFQVNDGAEGARTGIRAWADPTGAGYQSTARWGVGQLVAAGGTTPTPTPTPTTPGETPQGPWAKVEVARTVEQGGSLAVRVSELDPGQQIGATLYSDPIVVQGIRPADANGRTAFSIAIPADLPLGVHRLVITSGDLDPITVEVTVVAPGRLAITGAEPPLGIALLAALAVVLGGLLHITRRRVTAS